jgi:UDP-2,4-diacetamido-2,4,6-trideoxy-beta-L-altropyranose hydrolase
MLTCAFRVDASRAIGTGHVMRTLTLADALKPFGARSQFVSRHLPDYLATLIRERGHQLQRLPVRPESVNSPKLYAEWLGTSQAVDAADTISAMGSERIDWLVVDHYALDCEWESALRSRARRILAIDDLADRDHDCDLLLDQNFRIGNDARYEGKVPPQARLMLGPRFALLREEFRRARQTAQLRSGTVRRVLVFFGGMDGADYTSIALEGLLRVPSRDFAVDVVIGAAHKNLESIRSLCQANSFTLHVQTERMAELMAVADLTIGAGGSATWERCSVGLPSLVLAVSDNQRALVRDAALASLVCAPDIRELSAEAFARHFIALRENPLLLRSMSASGMQLVDGRGAERAARAMASTSVVFRLATAADSERLFRWRNHPQVRQVSRSKEMIDWATHTAWLDSALANPNRLLLIAEFVGQPLGVVRFDITGDLAEVSIYKVLDIEAQGVSVHGSGRDLLIGAEDWLQRHHKEVRVLAAKVLGDNIPSHRLFESAGYGRHATTYMKRIGS